MRNATRHGMRRPPAAGPPVATGSREAIRARRSLAAGGQASHASGVTIGTRVNRFWWLPSSAGSIDQVAAARERSPGTRGRPTSRPSSSARLGQVSSGIRPACHVCAAVDRGRVARRRIFRQHAQRTPRWRGRGTLRARTTRRDDPRQRRSRPPTASATIAANRAAHTPMMVRCRRFRSASTPFTNLPPNRSPSVARMRRFASAFPGRSMSATGERGRSSGRSAGKCPSALP